MEMLKERAAARYLGVSIKCLQKWRWLKTGPVYYRIGGSIRYTELDLDEFIAAGRVYPKYATDAQQEAASGN